MGIMVVGTPLSWEETKAKTDYVRQHGLQQLLHIYNEYKDRKFDSLKWGDEVEYMIIKDNKEEKKIQLVLRVESLYKELNETHPDDEFWQPEVAAYILEGIPGQPYGSTTRDCLKVEKSMIRRRRVHLGW